MMARTLFLSALLIAAAAPAFAAPTEEKAARDANNFDVILSQYPARARAAGEQGAVGFKVTLDRDGYATGCEVTHTSGHPKLDRETCDLILSRAVFRGSGQAGGSVHQGMVNWRLDAASSTPLVAVAASAKAVPEKKICRRRLKTGSLADYERLCATKADWARMSQRAQEEWGALQGTLGSTRSN